MSTFNNNHVLQQRSGILNDLLNKLPSFELSYETIQHKIIDLSALMKRSGIKDNVYETNRVSEIDLSDDSMILHMPYGRKYYVWFTVCPHTGENVVVQFPVGLNGRAYIDNTATVTTSVVDAPIHLFFGTLITVFQVGKKAVITDMHIYRGVPIGTIVSQKTKWSLLLQDVMPHFTYLAFPVFQRNNETTVDPGYKVHHIQVRRWSTTGNYMKYNDMALQNTKEKPNTKEPVSNVTRSLNILQEPVPSLLPVLPSATADMQSHHKKPQYTQITTFNLMADTQYDLYKLYADTGSGNKVFVDYACVVDMNTSKWLNRLFRNIKENVSLDAIEESDGEEDFNDVSENKYTNLTKIVRIHCKFNHRLRKWIPIEESRGPVVYLNRL